MPEEHLPPLAVMMRDTISELQVYLSRHIGKTEFDRGYCMGLADAIEMLKQCEAVGLKVYHHRNCQER